MRGMMRSLVVGAALSVLAAAPARGAFHIAVIDEVMSGVGSDASVQYVEIRMLIGGQTVVTNTRLTVFSCDGTTQQVLLLVPGPNLRTGGAGVRWIMATPSFAAAACITPDFTFTPTGTGIFPACGMVCWGAPGVVPPAPSWDPTNPNNYVDCVAYGPYTGPTHTGFTSANPATLTGGTMSLTRTADDFNDSTDFALAAPSPRNNAGQTGAFTGAPCPSTTTTTTPTGSTTTTTTGGGGGPGGSLGPPLSGGGAKTDCFGEWRVAGAAGPKPLVKCVHGDTACDTGTGGMGCTFRAQLCFGDAAASLYKGKCAGAPVTGVQVVSPAKDAADQNNAAAIGAALAAIGASGGAFATAPAAGACTAPFDLFVPLKTAKSGKLKKGARTIKTVITAGKADRDKLKLICTP